MMIVEFYNVKGFDVSIHMNIKGGYFLHLSISVLFFFMCGGG